MTHTRTAAIYTRISNDKEGEELGVTRQLEDCRALAAREGLQVVREYRDNDVGASTRTRRRKRRHDYKAMIESARAGEFQVILSYSNSRLTRRPMELEDLIKLYEGVGTRIITVVSGRDDLDVADGRLVARMKASVDAAEVERTSERLQRYHLQAAQAGRTVGGSRPFGWLPDCRSLDPLEAAAIIAAAQAVSEGVPVRRVAEEWNDQGLRTPFGNRWNVRVVSRVLKSPRLAGWRIYKDKIATDTQGSPVRGDFEAILTQQDHDRVLAVLGRPDTRGRVPRKGARRYLLTGTVRCGTCGALMYGNFRAADGKHNKIDTHYYSCRDGAVKHVVTASGHEVDAVVRGALERALGQPELPAPEPSPFSGAARLNEITEQIAELMAAYRAGDLPGSVVFPEVKTLTAEQEELSARGRDHDVAQAGRHSERLTPEQWSGLDLDRQRAVVEDWIDSVVIHPAEKRSRYFDSDRVDIVWR